jgi:uncharacterized protein YndB with AHSA1/START domain
MMANSQFIYVTYIRTTPEKLWQALIDPEFTRQYWVDSWQESDWKPGSAWRLMKPGDSKGDSSATDSSATDSGEVVEIEPPRRLVLKWRHEHNPELHEDGYSRLTYTLETVGQSVKLTILHESDVPESKLIKAVSGGWPHILASLKSLLETGESLAETRTWPRPGCAGAGKA